MPIVPLNSSFFFSVLEYEILEHPRKRHRRNSDSNLYRKASKVEVEQTESQLERALEGGVQLDIEKRMFVENYLQNIHVCKIYQRTIRYLLYFLSTIGPFLQRPIEISFGRSPS